MATERNNRERRALLRAPSIMTVCGHQLPPGGRFSYASAFILLAMAAATGCSSGDVGEPADQSTAVASAEDAENPAEEQKKKSALEIGPLEFQPAYVASDTAAPPKQRLVVKPGHWIPTLQRMQANADDFIGTASTTLVDEQMQPVPLEDTRFTFEVTRPVVLAKERVKLIEGEVFAPKQESASHLRSRLLQGSSGSVVESANLLLTWMPSYQYYVIVVAKEASTYAYLKVTDSVRAEWEEEFQEPPQAHYRVVLSDTKDGVNLPSSLISWSSIAYVVWDEVDVTQLSAAQQEALVDWLHWGGRLIISGPDSLDTLRGSFLEKYLPAEASGLREFPADELKAWSAIWGERSAGETLPPLEPERPLSGVKLAARAGAREAASGGGLFYEKAVGLGSIIVSAVQLNERELVNWPGFDGLLNAVLLGRPRREFSEGPYGGLRVGWLDYPSRRRDAHLVTGLRMFARDAGSMANIREEQQHTTNQFGMEESKWTSSSDRPGGLGAWNDRGPVSHAASDLLVEAAGVQMPGAGFVMACLAAYLVVLVPLNWMVFHTLGRLEWAWFAAPLIALAATYGVVKMAQLDIGFVRSQTEIALLELQPDYPRGVLSRYTALYSSLSTTYDVKFNEADAVAAPFAGTENFMGPDDRLYEVSLEKHADTVLRGLAVASNSTRMVHSEQLMPLAGPVRLGLSSRNERQLENYSGFNLRDVAVVRRFFKAGEDDPLYEASWIGDLRSGASTALGLRSYDWTGGKIPYAEERERSAVGQSVERMDLDGLLQLAFQFPSEDDPRNARREMIRLVARVDAVLPGAEISPAASQVRGATVVLAHLKYGDPSAPLPDVNSRADLNLTTPDLFDEEPATDD